MKSSFRIFRHSLTMVGRTLRSYMLLSVTIVLSFSLLLGYLGLVDSEVYNTNKHIFEINRGNLMVQDMGNPQRLDTLLEKAAQMEDTCFYTVYSTWVRMSDGEYVTSAGNTLYARYIGAEFLSGYVWEFFRFFGESYPIQWLDGQTHDYVDLHQGEAILDLASYYALGLDKLEEPVYTFRFSGFGNDCLEMTVKIVGLVDVGGPFFTESEEGLDYNYSDYSPMILLPMTGLTPQDISMLQPSRYAVFYTENPQELYQLATDLGFELGLEDSVYRWQDSVLESIQTQKGTKALIACAMLLILGINLYSSFSNALSERKFEIGVKRAIGASSFHIVRQFLYESITVMVVNILISIALVVDAGLIYRLVVQNTRGKTDFVYETYTLYLSPYSMGIFLTCAVTLTVVFSLIFAYKSTQVQVIDYLKAE